MMMRFSYCISVALICGVLLSTVPATKSSNEQEIVDRPQHLRAKFPSSATELAVSNPENPSANTNSKVLPDSTVHREALTLSELLGVTVSVSTPSNTSSPTQSIQSPSPGPTPEPTKTISRGKAYPLGLCEGACRDDDDDCEGDLYCFPRAGFEAVPGCRGGTFEATGMSYCVLPEYRPPSVAPSSRPTTAPVEIAIIGPETNNFQLRLYWEEGYFWQESNEEDFWCATFDYDGYNGRGRCHVSNQRQGDCNSNQMYVSDCDDDENQQFVFVPLTNDEILIKPDNGDDQCWTRSRREIFLEDCNEENEYQRWFAPNGGFDEYRFEISQRGFESQCVSTDHHAKEGEVVELHSCDGTRRSDTSYWERYIPSEEVVIGRTP